MKEKIPDTVINLLSDIFAEKYTHEDINRIFQESGAPSDIPPGKKTVKTANWLHVINHGCDEPLIILGSLLKQFWKDHKFSYEREIHKCLINEELRYLSDGKIDTLTDPFNTSLNKTVHKLNIQEVDKQINRALKNVETDPSAASHAAARHRQLNLEKYDILK